MCDVAPHAIGLVAERGRMIRVAVHGVEKQLGQGTGRGAHGWNLTTKVTGEPGTVSPPARCAIAFTTTLSGTDGPRSRTLTKAMPVTPVVTVSVVTRVWVESFVTSKARPGDAGAVIAEPPGRAVTSAAQP